ncbi:DUF305 domain-containing protein [Thiobacillus sp.]|uniref:DUF305 domain-containing protein n=1 Tax=Thiobacillus sp. TaxID=924 RepID=UPI0025E56812|nr:DUF305 domain-containing protein [Thiobacillus sp.]
MKRLPYIAFVLMLSASALAEKGAAPHAHHSMAVQEDVSRYPAQFQRFIREMDRDMEKMMTDMHHPGYTGNADVDFLAMMIPHHQGAVDMARLVLIHGQDPLARQLAEEIMASQQAEIMAMKARLNILSKGADPDPGGYPALNGVRGQY